MAGMKWFWRLVCAPDCSEACQVNCPGCYAMASEWEERGLVTPVTGKTSTRFRWQDFHYLWTCWSRSASARVVAKLNPVRRRSSVTSAATGGGCGCGPETAVARMPRVDAGIDLTDISAPAEDPIRGEVRRFYDGQAKNVTAQDGCCGTAALPEDVSCVPSYRAEELKTIPQEAIIASLGCGNPFAHADLRPGEVVLDLGSGGGLDALVAAKRVGPDGHVFGLDMSDEMLALAGANAARAGATNVAFVKGDMEAIPLPRNSVDVIISNCVVNLVPDKAAALAEAFRVLRPGGRLSISDIVTRTPVPDHLKGDLTAWAACIGGALSVDEYTANLRAAGFVDIDIERDREYTMRDAQSAGVAPILERAGVADALALGFANTSVRARRPLPTETVVAGNGTAPSRTAMAVSG